MDEIGDRNLQLPLSQYAPIPLRQYTMLPQNRQYHGPGILIQPNFMDIL